MGYDRGDSFPFDFESNGIPFGLKSKGKLSPWSIDHIPFNFKVKGNIIFSVYATWNSIKIWKRWSLIALHICIANAQHYFSWLVSVSRIPKGI